MTVQNIRVRVLPRLIPSNGKEVEMRSTDDFIQWRLGNGDWVNLVALSELTGAPGVIQAVFAGPGATVDNTNPAEPVVGVNLLDEDDMASNSDIAVPSQQSAKAYADTKGAYYASRAAAEAATVPSVSNFIRVLSPGTGHILSYKRRTTVGTGALSTAGGEFDPDGEVYPDHFGENTTPGTTEMAPAINAAVAYAAKRVSGLQNVTYKVSDKINVKSNFKIKFGSSPINASGLVSSLGGNRPDGVFEAVGTGITTTVTSAAAKRARTVVVDSAAGLTVGMAFTLTALSERWYQEGGAMVGRYYAGKIINISGTTITLDKPLPFSFDPGIGIVAVYAWDGIKNVTIEVGDVTGPGFIRNLNNGTGEALLYAYHTQNIRLISDGGKITGFPGGVAWIQRHMNPRVSGLDMQGLPDDHRDIPIEGEDANFTGLIFTEGRGFVARNNIGRRLRHMIDGSRTWAGRVIDNSSERCHRAAFGSHLGWSNTTFIGNRDRNSSSSCLWRGHSATWIGNDFEADQSLALAGWYDTAGHADDIPKVYRFVGNRFVGGRNGMQFLANIGVCTGSDNEVVGGIEGAYPAFEITTLHLDTLIWRGGTIRTESTSTGDCVYVQPTTPDWRRNIQFHGVNIADYGSNGIDYRASQADGGSVLTVQNCTFRPGSGSSHIITNSQVFAHLVLAPNFLSTGLITPLPLWTPTLTDSSGNAVGYSNQTGRYSIVNGWFIGEFRISVNSVSGVGSGSGLRMAGFPVLPTAGGYIIVSQATGLSITAGQSMTGMAVAGSNRFDLRLWSATTGTAAMVGSNITSSTDIRGVVAFPIG